jgi:hypothetical protein
MEAGNSSETLLPIYHNIRHHILDYEALTPNRRQHTASSTEHSKVTITCLRSEVEGIEHT